MKAMKAMKGHPHIETPLPRLNPIPTPQDILKAAQKGTLKDINPRYITARLLGKEGPRDEEGQGIIHFAIKSGEISLLDEKYLTLEVLSQKDKEGQDGFMLAAMYDHFEYIPKDLLTENILLQRNKTGQSVLDNLLSWRKLKDVPAHLLTKKVLFDKNTDMDLNAIERAAISGILCDVPQDFLTEEILTKEDEDNLGAGTLLDLAAAGGCLDVIKPEILDRHLAPEVLAKRLEVSQRVLSVKTPIHLAAERGTLAKIPNRFLTKKHMELRDGSGKTPLHLAAACFWKNPIPEELLKEELLTLEDNSGLSVLNVLFLDYKKRLEDGTLEKALKALSPKTLKRYLKPIESGEGIELVKKELKRKKLKEEFKNEEELSI